MAQRERLDTFGIVSLVGFSALVGFNQVVVKVTNEGIQPVFSAGLRSLGAVICVGLWMWARGIRTRPLSGTTMAGCIAGTFFAVEFILLFTALDLTTVTRTSVLFYSMPVWMALGAHFLIPGQRLTRPKCVGLLVAFLGVVVAIGARGSGDVSGGSALGDMLALGAAVCWAAAGLMAKGSALSREGAEMQLMWQIVVSTPILLVASLFFGPLIRNLGPIHLAGLAFQTVVVVSAGFVFWFFLLKRYPAAQVAAYSFLGPVFGVFFGWSVLGERVGPALLVALGLVALGLYLMNRPVDQVPQKV